MMNIFKLAVAAAIALGTISAPAAPAMAQDHHGDRRDGNWRDNDRRDDNGRHRGWRNNRNRGWHNRRVCRTVWRHHHRQRICRMVRYRR